MSAQQMQALADRAIATRRFQPKVTYVRPEPAPRRPSIVAAELKALEAAIDLSAPYSNDYHALSRYHAQMTRIERLRVELREVSAPYSDAEAVVEAAVRLAHAVLGDKCTITVGAAKCAHDVIDRASGIDMDALRQRVATRHYAAMAAMAKGGAL